MHLCNIYIWLGIVRSIRLPIYQPKNWLWYSSIRKTVRNPTYKQSKGCSWDYHNTRSTQKPSLTQKCPVRHKGTWFDTKCPVWHKNALPGMPQLPLPLSNILPLPLRNIFFNFYLNILFNKKPIENWKWNNVDIEIYLISLWNMNYNYSFLFVMILMSAAINKYYWYGSIIRPTSAFSFDCSIKIWNARSYDGSIMHSTRIFVITVSNNRVSCRPYAWAKIGALLPL